MLHTFHGASPLLLLTRAGTLTSRNPLISSCVPADMAPPSGLQHDQLRHNMAATDGAVFMAVIRPQNGKERLARQVDVKILTGVFALSRQKRLIAA